MGEAVVIKPAASVTELKEVIEAVLEVSIKITSVLKDGYQPADLAVIFELFSKDSEMKNKIAKAYDGISKIGGEVHDLDASEGIELAIAIMLYVPKFIEALKKGK